MGIAEKFFKVRGQRSRSQRGEVHFLQRDTYPILIRCPSYGGIHFEVVVSTLTCTPAENMNKSLQLMGRTAVRMVTYKPRKLGQTVLYQFTSKSVHARWICMGSVRLADMISATLVNTHTDTRTACHKLYRQPAEGFMNQLEVKR